MTSFDSESDFLANELQNLEASRKLSKGVGML